MHAAGDCAQQLLLPAAAGICGGTRASEAARPDFHSLSSLRQPPAPGGAVARGDFDGPPARPRLMRKLGLWAVRPKRNTSKRHPGHKVYPYLLRGKTIDRANQVWAADITYIPMRQGFLYLVAIIDWATRRVLSWRLSNTLTAGFCVEALSEALARFGKPGIFNTDQSLPSRKRWGAIHQRGVHQDTTGSWDRDQQGRTRALPRQHLCRALVVDREARMGLLAPGRQRHRTEAQPGRVLRLV